MRAGQSSYTAELVLQWRALAHRGFTTVPGFADPFAEPLLGDAGRKRFAANLARMERAPSFAARWSPRFAHVVLRAVALDALLAAEIAAGTRQLVVLGAGYDTRAWRLAELAGVRVFEVDHPDTQAAKRAQAASLPAPVSPQVFVPVDFLRDTLADRLAEAGHDAAAPTVWVWEGVVMYLADDAVRATLAAVRERSSPDSRLLLHYHTPNPPSILAVVRAIYLWLVGEPHIGLRTPEAIAGLLTAAGFRVDRDLDLDAQAALVGAAQDARRVARVSRVVVAAT